MYTCRWVSCHWVNEVAAPCIPNLCISVDVSSNNSSKPWCSVNSLALLHTYEIQRLANIVSIKYRN
jgi:hypothetical protein